MTSRMQDYLPKYYDDSQIVTEMMSAETEEFDALNAEQYKTLDQFFISSSTYALSRWERVLDLPPAPNADVEFRRKRILAKLAGNAPATVRYLTDLVNVYVPKKDAQIVEFNSEHRFEAEIPAENEINLASIYDSVGEVKPAHLEFGVTSLSREAINVGVHPYNFPVTYRICNMFRTADMPGILAKTMFNLQEKSYSFDVFYPVCNMFTTTGYEARSKSDVGMTVKTDVYHVPYVYVGDIELGGGIRLGGRVDDEDMTGFRAIMRLNTSVSDVLENPVGIETESGTWSSKVIYNRVNSITLGEDEL